MKHHPEVPGTALLGDLSKPIFSHSLQHDKRRTDALIETIRGVSHDFNPWDRYGIDGGYCLDAPNHIPDGSHENHSDRHVFANLIERE